MQTPDAVSKVKMTSPSPFEGNSEIKVNACSDRGRVREENQDNFVFRKDAGLYLVADGMGGRAGGELASSLACEVIAEELARSKERLKSLELNGRRSLISGAINKASLKIYERSLELPQFRGMGTTTTLLWASPFRAEDDPFASTAIIAHVGDSRCYLNRCGLLFQVTDDHSLVNEQIKAGILSAHDPLIGQMRNVITRCVGYQEEEDVDTIPVKILRGDRFLICSDGLHNKVSDEEIRQALRDRPIETICQELVSLANERGGEDNITVLVVEF